MRESFIMRKPCNEEENQFSEMSTIFFTYSYVLYGDCVSQYLKETG